MQHSFPTFCLKMLTLFLVLISPIKAVMLTVGFLIFSDLLTGVWAALKRKERITSASLRRTLSKMVVYQLAILSSFLIERHLIGSDLPFVKITAGYIGIVEFTSILENSNFILGTNLFKFLIKIIGSKNE